MKLSIPTSSEAFMWMTAAGQGNVGMVHDWLLQWAFQSAEVNR